MKTNAIALLLVTWTGQAVFSQAPAAEMPWLAAPALKPGDTVAIVAPAGPVDLAAIRQYVQALEKAGYKVIMPKKREPKFGYLAGTDQERADEFNAALHNDQVRAIMPCRGGYGLTRILDSIDYAALRKQPKIITGFSDLTALHLAVARQARVITFHSPMPTAKLWDEEQPYAFAADSFRRAVFAASYAKGQLGYALALPKDGPAPVKLVAGTAKGRLVGGNLSLVAATLGTPYAIQAKGNLVFLEDVNEAPYRIDRMLSQLRLAGVLDQASGIILGGFTTKNADDARGIDAVLRDYFGTAKVPVLMRFPVGHQALNATLPHGALAELDADRAVVRLLENPVRVN